MNNAPDYRYLGRCEFETGEVSLHGHDSDCGDPAIAKVWWEDENKDGMLVCREHLDMIMRGRG